MMNTSKRKKLIYKLLLFTLPLLLASILLTGIILSWTSYNHFQKAINVDYENILKSSAGEVNLFMKNAQKGLESLAWVISATKMDGWQKEMALAAFNHTATEFMSVSLMSREGKRILSTSWEKDDAVLSHDDETLKIALSGQNAISQVMLTRENIPYVHMSVPLLHLGQVREILWGELNLKSVWDVLEGIKVGETGRVSIMDLTGRFIGHVEMDRVVKALPANSPGIVTRLHDANGPVAWIEERDGTKLYCLGYHIPHLDWVIVLSQAHSEMYAYLYKSVYWAVLVTCLICLAAIVMGWNRVKRFLAPIGKLHYQVKRIGGGDLDQKVSIDSEDEIGDLALAFNEMTDSLKKFIRREVETAKDLAHAKNLAILGSTSSKVTHEVGNLLNNVGLTLTTLKGETLSKPGTQAIAILEKDSARVRDFIRNFLQFAKRPELHLEKMSIEKIIREIVFIYKTEADKRGIHLETDWPSDLPSVSVDANVMYQVLNNLVKNSFEAMTDSGRIRIDGAAEEEHLVVRIEDTGPGITPDILEQIFDPFFTTKGKRGTGLGLSIVKTMVEAHRGTIECESALTRGTTFIIRLPVQ